MLLAILLFYFFYLGIIKFLILLRILGKIVHILISITVKGLGRVNMASNISNSWIEAYILQVWCLLFVFIIINDVVDKEALHLSKFITLVQKVSKILVNFLLSSNFSVFIIFSFKHWIILHRPTSKDECNVLENLSAKVVCKH